MLERVSLFNSQKERLYFGVLILCILFLSLSIEFYNYKEFTKFDSQLIHATVLKQYSKTKLTKTGKTKEYQVLKLRSDDGLTFYTTAPKTMQNLQEKNIELEIWAGEISFYEYMRTFFGFSHIIQITPDTSFKATLRDKIREQHADENISAIYEALYLAQPLKSSLQTIFSNLGISHLIAISGYHLGVLSGILFFLCKLPYSFFHARYFPYRSQKRDLLLAVVTLLLLYMLFLDMPPSLLRAFVMLLVGIILYDRGVKIISMQTLLVSVVLILAFFPRLFFNIGFWLSASGVFYIFLFLMHFKNLSKAWQFLLLPFWLYLMMLPYSLTLFSNFTLYHPLSIIWSISFTLFYPLSILLHLLGIGNWSDFILVWLLNIDPHVTILQLNLKWLIIEILFSFIAIYFRSFIYLLLTLCSSIFIYSIYNVT